MRKGDLVNVDGFITREWPLLGKNPSEMAALLGILPYRFSDGAWILRLLRLPAISEFEFAGYTHFVNGVPANGPMKLDFDIDKNKILLIENKWKLVGPDRLVKVIAKVRHQSSDDYEIAKNPVEQWKLTASVPAEVVADLKSRDMYLPYGG